MRDVYYLSLVKGANFHNSLVALVTRTSYASTLVRKTRIYIWVACVIHSKTFLRNDIVLIDLDSAPQYFEREAVNQDRMKLFTLFKLVREFPLILFQSSLVTRKFLQQRQ